MSLIPHYDPADGKLLNLVSDATAQRYVAEGIAHAVRTKNGRIARLYRRVRERAYGTARDGIGALHAAGQTTQRIRLDGGALVRKHKRADGWGWDEAFCEAGLALCNRHQAKHPRDCICDRMSPIEVFDEIIRLRYAPWLRHAELGDNPRTFTGHHRLQFSSGMISAVAEHGPVAPDPRSDGTWRIMPCWKATEKLAKRKK